jgi:ABC-2 type transport system permease protein
VSVRGVLAVAAVECAKLARQIKVHLLLALCLIGPFSFAVAMRVQSSLPVDTLFGRAVKESGLALSMVVLGFAALWVFPVLASVVGGDMFAAEDRHGTWPTLLTRSRTRAEVFTGKVVTALGFSLLALLVLSASSVAAGVLVIGTGPLIDLTGVERSPADALMRVTQAWASVVPPILGFTALAVLLSVATRSSAAGIGLPVVIGLVMQLYAFVDGPEVIRYLLITTAFGSWHGLLSQPSYHTPLVYGIAVSTSYLIVCIVFAYHRLRSRDVTS